jgi:hypothetical protein
MDNEIVDSKRLSVSVDQHGGTFRAGLEAKINADFN